MSLLLGLIDFALFQLAWLVCVTQAAHGRPALGIAAVAGFVALQLARSTQRVADVALLAMALVLGLAWDSGLQASGLVHYASPGPLHGVAPAWILALWALFAVVLRGPLRWLIGKPFLAAALGAIGGPASYLAAAHLGACVLTHDGVSLAVLAGGWSLFTPLLLDAARRLEATVPWSKAARS